MSVAGITINRTLRGKPTFIPVKWTEKMKKSFSEGENGEVYSRSLEELLSI